MNYYKATRYDGTSIILKSRYHLNKSVLGDKTIKVIIPLTIFQYAKERLVNAEFRHIK